MIYGYARISTKQQKVQRQIDNIKKDFPNAVVITEEYTGTTTDRPNFNKLLKKIRRGDTVVFDEVSRMSRNAAEGIELYEELFDKDVNLVFIKEPHINTSVYRDRMNKQIEKLSSTGSKATDKLLDSIMNALHEYTIDLAREQIELAFKTAQAEVDFLHQRTSEGVRKAQERYKEEEMLGLPHEKNNVGQKKGAKLTTKKSKEAKVTIKKHNKDFDGTLTDVETMKLVGISRNSYYKYKRELKEQQ